MPKFDLKVAMKAAQDSENAEPMSAGYHRVVITQVAEVGLQPAFNRDDEPKASVGVVFENATGLQVCKVMPLTVSTYSNLGKLLSAIEPPDEFKDLLNQELVLEIEANGKWPKIVGYYHVDDGLSAEPSIGAVADSIYYSVDEPAPETLKRLHSQLKQAIAARIRVKGV